MGGGPLCARRRSQQRSHKQQRLKKKGETKAFGGGLASTHHCTPSGQALKTSKLFLLVLFSVHLQPLSWVDRKS